MARIIDGKAIALEIRQELAHALEHANVQPGLALLLVGNNPASEVYVSNKAKACKEVGMYSMILRLPENTSEEEVISQIHAWNSDSSIHGILVQLPLPKQINEQRIIMTIRPDKDVDGFHPENVGRLTTGLPGFVPCTPAGIMELFKRCEINPSGKHVVVVGRSNIVGKPIANLLYQKKAFANAVVTICHTGAPDITKYTKQADILIAAVGVPNLLTNQDIKEGVVCIDVGINRVEDSSKKNGFRLIGDFHYSLVEPLATAITPVPGGVGPMTIAMLLMNTYTASLGTVFTQHNEFV